jgi:hypothetical protein
MTIFIIIINLIVNIIKLNSVYLGIMHPSIINPNGKFYDFINDDVYTNDDIQVSDKLIGYSKVNLTNCKKARI